MSKLKRLLEIIDDREKMVIAHFPSDDQVARQVVEYLIEGGRTVGFDNRYCARLDKGHVPGQQDHVHLLFKGKDVCVINRDGTASHKSDLNAIPRYLRPKLRGLGVKIEEAYLIIEASETSVVVAALRDNITMLEAAG
jgi:hypothetical protein